jgi:hypothetical protein
VCGMRSMRPCSRSRNTDRPLARFLLSGGSFSCILSHICFGGLPAGGEDFQAHIAAGFGPFVVLLGQHRAETLLTGMRDLFHFHDLGMTPASAAA